MKIQLIPIIVLLIGLSGLSDLLTAQHLDYYHCTWMGNTFPGGYTEGKWVQHSLHDAVVTPDGKVITAALGEEGRRRCGFYKDGTIWDNGNDRTNGTLEGVVGGTMCSGGNCFKSKTVAYHPDQTWVYGNHKDGVSIRRWHYHGLIDDHFSYNLGGRAEGLAANNQMLVASFNNEMTVLNINDASEIRKFEVPSPTKIALDPEGDIWVVCSGNTEVREYSPEGGLKTTLSENGWGPEDVSFDHTGRLMVSDNGPDQQVKFYDVSGEDPVLDGTLGQQGGITAGTPGMVTGDKLWDLKASGTDSAGNIYVIMATGHHYPTIRSYTPEGQTLRWEIHGIEFCTVADYDAQTGAFHSYYNTYDFDFAAPPDGSQWQLTSHNIDPIAYPNDMRISQGLGFSTQFRRINGKGFLFLTNMSAHNLHIYRFEDEIAVPSMAFSASSEDWALGNPGGNWIWTDKNGNGDYEAGEYSTGSGIKRWSWWVDTESTIWNAYKYDIYAFPCQGLDDQGNPIYTFASRKKYEVPEPFNFIMRAKYDPVTDVMILSGYTEDHPKSEVKYGSNKGAGLVFARYDNWLENPQKKWVQVLEYELDYNSWENQLWPRSFDVAGDYMFVVWGSFGPSGKDKANPVLWSRGEVTVYDLETGEKTGYMLPDSVIGGPPPSPSRPTITGAQDMAHSVHAHQRDNGEYIVVMEENKWAKNVMYRWCPSGDCMESSMEIHLNHPPNDTLLYTYNGITLEPEIVKDTCTIDRVEYYANDKLMGTDVTPPYAFTLPDTSLEEVQIQARLIERTGAYKLSEKRYLTVSNGTPVTSLTEPLPGREYNMNDTLYFSAEAFDYDGTIDSIEFYVNGTRAGSDTTAPFQYKWQIPDAGDYKAYAMAWDDSGQSGISSTARLLAYGYRPAAEPETVKPGFIYEYYEGSWDNLPDFSRLSALYKDTSSLITIDRYGREDHFAFRFTGYIQVPEKGRYTFYTSSSDGSRLSIGNRLIVDNDGVHYNTEESGVILLEQGLHPLEVTMFDQSGSDNLSVQYEGPGIAKQDIPSEVLFRPVGTPPAVSLTNPADDVMYNAGDAIRMRAAIDDPDEDVHRIEFYTGATLIGHFADTGHVMAVDTLPAGMHTLTAKAYDLGGSVSESEPRTITVNAHPAIEITAPEPLSEYTGLNTIRVEVQVTDDNAQQVSFYVNEVLTKTLNAEPWEIQLTGMDRGTKFIMATATDANNLQASDKIQIKIVNTPPVVSILAPDSGAVFAPGEEIELQADVTDPDGDVYKVAFYEGSQQIGGDANIYYQAKVNNLPEGTHTITARAFDKEGAVSESEPVVITVGSSSAIDMRQNAYGLSVYPNPLEEGLLHIEPAGNNAHMGIITVTVSDVLGKKVIQKSFNTSAKNITVSADELPGAGIYFIAVKIMDVPYRTTLIVK